MSFVLPDGYVLDSIGPFRGNMNDASITQHVLLTCDSLIGWCEDDDVMLVDRGFWDVMYTFRKIGYEPKMPAFLRKGQTQHTTEEANKVTILYQKLMGRRIIPCSDQKMASLRRDSSEFVYSVS